MSGDGVAKNHKDRFLEDLNKLRLDEKLTDFTICIDKELIKVHKNILAANSDYFKAMLTSDSSEIKNGQVTLEDVDPEAVKLLVNFWYTGKMESSSENICSLLLVTSRFQAREALEVCTNFARANLNAANCLSIAVICDRCNLIDLFEEAFTCCLKNFEEIIQDTKILQIDAELLTRMISDDRLNISDEAHVFELIIRWIEFDKDLRYSTLEQLMKEVRFASINPISLYKPDMINFCESSADYRKFIDKAKTVSLLKNHPDSLQKHVGEFKSEPRKSLSSINKNQRLFVFSGKNRVDDTQLDCEEYYNPLDDEWSYDHSNSPIEQHLAVKIENNFIYALSADDNQTPRYFDLNTLQWSQGEHLFHRPTGGFLVALAGCIYSFGSSNNNHIRYDMATKTSTICAPLHEPRENSGFVAHDKYIYVIGGSKIGSEHALQSVERYNSREDKWETVASMKKARMSFSSCVCRGKIYVAGGSNCGEIMAAAEVYDPKLDSWTNIPPMMTARADLGLVELLEIVYAVGGRRSKVIVLSQVEAYNPDTNKWTEVKSMNFKRFAACVLAI